MNIQRKIWLIAGIVVFTAYFFVASRAVPRETVLVPRWISSLETGVTFNINGGGEPAPELQNIAFQLGDKFGYIDQEGNYSFIKKLQHNISLPGDYWVEYDAMPSALAICDSSGDVVARIENPIGYPFFLGRRIFLLGKDQNMISEIDTAGSTCWTYDFSSPLTCIDSAAGLVLAGSLDGSVDVLDSSGKLVFNFEPGGSRYPVILGCAVSSDGRRLAVVSGIEDQRFLLLERFGSSAGDYKVIYHEFLETGFRRPVHVVFTSDDRWVVFERSGGLGIYETGARQSNRVFLAGDIYAIDNSGSGGIIFVIVAYDRDEKNLVCIKLPGSIMMEMPFKSSDAFLDRIDRQLFAGGGQSIISFDLGKR